MSKRRNVPSWSNRVKRVKRRDIIGTGAKTTSPGSFVYIDIEREQDIQSKSEQITIDNEFYLTAKEENELEESIDSSADGLRDSLMGVLSQIVGYEKATGQIEAVARDILDTEVEHDSSVYEIVQAVGQLDVLCYLTQRSKNIPKGVQRHFMRRASRIFAEAMPSKIQSKEKLQRHRQLMDNIIAVSSKMGKSPEGPYISEPHKTKRR